jgi:hypothetical protein
MSLAFSLRPDYGQDVRCNPEKSGCSSPPPVQKLQKVKKHTYLKYYWWAEK